MLTKEYYRFCHRSFLYSFLKLALVQYVINTNKAFQIMGGGGYMSRGMCPGVCVRGGICPGGIFPREYLFRG